MPCSWSTTGYKTLLLLLRLKLLRQNVTFTVLFRDFYYITPEFGEFNQQPWTLNDSSKMESTDKIDIKPTKLKGEENVVE